VTSTAAAAAAAAAMTPTTATATTNLYMLACNSDTVAQPSKQLTTYRLAVVFDSNVTNMTRTVTNVKIFLSRSLQLAQ